MKLCVLTPSLLSLSLTLTAALCLGCASGNDKSGGAPPPTSDGGVDTGHSGGDTAIGGDCTPGFSTSQPCGKCGKQTRTCDADATWSAWSTCTGEKASAECKPGDTNPHVCGNCGTRLDTCDPDACIWVNGTTCSGEGACAPGTTDTKTCATAGESQTRTCSDTCSWGDYSTCAVPSGWKSMSAPPSTFLGRMYAAHAWTGTDLLVVGGTTVSGTKFVTLGDAMKWNLATDKWSAIAAPPSEFSTDGWTQMGFVWTGKELVGWGGYTATTTLADGAAYDPSTDTWRTLAPSPLSARAQPQLAWSPTEKKIYLVGGMTGSAAPGIAAYDPLLDTWSTISDPPISARSQAAVAWLGAPCECLAVWGGGSGDVMGLKDGATFDPSTSTWTKMADPPSTFDPRYQLFASAIGGDLVVYGGYGGPGTDDWAKNDGARWSSATNAWTTFTGDDAALAPTAHRFDGPGWTDGKTIWIWSGATTSMPSAVVGGGAYDLAGGTWKKMPGGTSAPASRRSAIVEWTGSLAIVWGGTDGLGAYLADGATFAP